MYVQVTSSVYGVNYGGLFFKLRYNVPACSSSQKFLSVVWRFLENSSKNISEVMTDSLQEQSPIVCLI